VFIIEKGIPVPASTSGRPTIYPLGNMDVGDSFSIPLPEGKKHRDLQSSVSRAAKAREGKTFSSRKVEGGVRVWRTA